MQDRTATMLILRSLQEIADELRALRQDLHQLTLSGARADADRPPRPKAPGLDDELEALLGDDEPEA